MILASLVRQKISILTYPKDHLPTGEGEGRWLSKLIANYLEESIKLRWSLRGWGS